MRTRYSIAFFFLTLLYSFSCTAVDKGPKISRICLDVSDSTVSIFWTPVEDACASFTSYDFFGQEDALSLFQPFGSELVRSTNSRQIKLPNLKSWRFFIRVSHACDGLSYLYSDTVFVDNSEPTQWALDSVSVDCETQRVMAGWQKHDTADVKGYLVYRFNPNLGTNEFIGDVDTLSFLGTNEDATLGVVTYMMAAYDSCNNTSPISNVHSTMFLNQSIDTCQLTVSFTWTPYVGWPVDSHHLMVSINGGRFLHATSSTGNELNMQYNYTPGDTVCAFVRAYKSGDPSISSASNKVCLNTQPSDTPSIFYLRKVSVKNKALLIGLAEIDTTVIKQFIVQKRSASGGVWQHYEQINPAMPNYYFQDPSVNVDIESYQYRLIGVDACNNPVDTSNSAKNILLSIENNSNLSWTQYNQFYDGFDHYHLLYSSPGSTWNTERLFVNDQSPTINYSPPEITNPDGSTKCFCVFAAEPNTNQKGFQDTSFSNQVCAIGVFRLYIPNAFSPNQDNKNEYFTPSVLNAKQGTYSFFVFNRWGEQLFHTTNPLEGWDGVYNNQPSPKGVYMYKIQVIGDDGSQHNKHGNFTLLR